MASRVDIAFGDSRSLGAHGEFISGPDLAARGPAVYASQPRSPVYSPRGYGHARLASHVTTSVFMGGTFTRGR